MYFREHPVLYIVIAFALLCVVLLVINIIDLNRFIVRKYVIKTSKVGKEKRIVFLTDLHLKKYGENNSKLIKAIDKLKPDYLLCGGDMIVATPGVDNKVAFDLFRELSKKYKIYYALGNHEFRAKIYPQKYGEMYQEFDSVCKECDIRILSNEKLELEDNITLYGLEIAPDYYKRFRVYPMEDSYIESVLGAVDKKKFNILLAHNPDYSDKYGIWGCDVSLSGHVHGGLIRLPFVGGIASPNVRFFPKYNGGIYTVGNTKAVVSCGLGTHTLPLRLFDPAELTLLVLKA